MSPDGKPFYGPTQPTYGLGRELLCIPMKGQKKTEKVIATELRKLVGVNVLRALETKYPHPPDKIAHLAKLAKVSKSTIQRIVGGKVGVSVDVLWTVADKLGISPFRLLMTEEDSRYLVDVREVVKEREAVQQDKSQRRRIA